MSKEPRDPTQDAAAASRPTPSRRSVIKGVAGMAGAAAAASALPASVAQASRFVLPPPAESGIDHIVVLMMENRSFDHILGWVPGANGVQAGRSFVDTKGDVQESFKLTLFQNCASADPDHSFEGSRTERNGGTMDGFLLTANAGDRFPIGFYSESDVPFFASAAKNWTICDRYFCSLLGPTFPNRFYMHSGQTDRLTTGGPSFDTGTQLAILPAIWDLLAHAGISGRYYFSDAPFLALYGNKFNSISFPFAQFQADAAAGTLPAVSYVDPAFVGEAQGTSSDDHPLADIRNGQNFMNQVYTALTNSPAWPRTLLIINYDEHGGFADHVDPPMAPVSPHEVKVGNVDAIHADGSASAFLGIRVPCLVMGPRAYRGTVLHQQYDANSILNLITWRFNLPNIGIRATTSGNFATALNFFGPADMSLPPAIPLATEMFGSSCAANPLADLDFVQKSFAQHFAELDKLKAMAAAYNFRTA
jgi:phospholipase C